jgi:hypothetical protein
MSRAEALFLAIGMILLGIAAAGAAEPVAMGVPAPAYVTAGPG